MQGVEKGGFVALPGGGVQARFVALREAAGLFGFRSADAMRQAFRRRILPERFCLRIGRARRVDVAGLAEHLRREAVQEEADRGESRAGE